MPRRGRNQAPPKATVTSVPTTEVTPAEKHVIYSDDEQNVVDVENPKPAKSVEEVPREPKRVKLGGNTSGIVMKPLSQITWCHSTMKSDIDAAHESQQDVTYVVNYHVRLAGWHTLEIDKVERQNFIQAAFSVSKSQMAQIDKDDGGVIKGPRPFAHIVNDHIRRYYNTLAKSMRDNFLCLLKMFL